MEISNAELHVMVLEEMEQNSKWTYHEALQNVKNRLAAKEVDEEEAAEETAKQN